MFFFLRAPKLFKLQAPQTWISFQTSQAKQGPVSHILLALPPVHSVPGHSTGRAQEASQDDIRAVQPVFLSQILTQAS